jgi:hypothetical protein
MLAAEMVCPPVAEGRHSLDAAEKLHRALTLLRNCLFGQKQKDPCHEVTPATNCHRATQSMPTLRRQVAVHEHAGRERVTRSQQSIGKPQPAELALRNLADARSLLRNYARARARH